MIAKEKFWDVKILGWEEARYRSSKWKLSSKTVKARLILAQKILNRLVSQGERKICDLGCGSGFLAETFCTNAEVNYKGVDFSSVAIAEAQRKFSQYKNIQFIQSEVSQFVGEPVDVSVFLGLTDWLSSDEMICLRDILESKYILFSYTSNQASPLIGGIYRGYRYLKDSSSYKARTYSRDDISSWLKYSQYKIIQEWRDKSISPGVVVLAKNYGHSN